MRQPDRFSSFRLPLFGLVIGMLLAGGWAALQRAGWALPMVSIPLVGMHGPLMMGGLFGTLIALERATAVGVFIHARWPYAAPVLSALGGLLLIVIGPHPVAKVCLLAGGFSLTFVYAYTATTRRFWSLHTAILCAGAAFWAFGSFLWLLGQPLYVVVHSWIAFLILTIVGERLELTRVRRLAASVERLLVLCVGLYATGALLTAVSLDAAVRLAGLGEVCIALWLLRFDIAGQSVRQSGLTRYIALCLIAGYLWLAVAGGFGLLFGAVYAGFQYDALIHAVLVGFVFSMVFGHAPLIIPALTGRQVAYHPIFYSALLLLHLTLLLRLYSDLTLDFKLRKWAGLLNAVAVLMFMFLLLYSLVIRRPSHLTTNLTTTS
ncbi:MAG: hypothetical protein HXY40_18430 [Chloroflexi bacterium]|nr:hypothetical protein [Chloroflexota bacterium]